MSKRDIVKDVIVITLDTVEKLSSGRFDFLLRVYEQTILHHAQTGGSDNDPEYVHATKMINVLTVLKAQVGSDISTLRSTAGKI